MTFEQIEYMNLINDVEESKVNELMDSIKENGFVGCPILVYGDMLLTGSHRLEALKRINDEEDIYDMEVAEDVTDIVEENISKYEEENGYVPEIDFSNIGWMLKGSWIEEYKSEIVEW